MYSGFMDGQFHVPTAESLAEGARFTMNRKLRGTLSFSGRFEKEPEVL
jgi:hypothetical protein